MNTWHLDGLDIGRDRNTKLQVVGRLIIDPNQVRIMKDGVTLDLSQREYDIVSFLAKEPEKIYAREDLLHHVWEYTDFLGDVRAVDVAIRRLRKKIEEDPAHPTIIINKRGRGYFLASGR